ncbi:hypothetical protein GCM10023205_25380 [Yinghuangia aomiensis]|uniref:Uncharacterized protein n=1 Tax=Yinghuangia aomiensis TaxID=676205 RepID=A0ABP9H476_9ACTN
MADPHKREIKARQKARGETYMQARRRLDEADPAPRHTVAAVGYLFDTSLPCTPTHTPPPGEVTTSEEVLAALVANSAVRLTREETGEVYPAYARAAVLPTDPTPGADNAPAGWYSADVIVLMGARRPWSAEQEPDEVQTDAYRAARNAVLRMWPIPEEWTPAALPLDFAQMFRRWTDADMPDLLRSVVARAVTVGGDRGLDPYAV